MTSTAVVILNYNGEKFLREFLSIVVRFTPGATICVIDNASTDSSVSFIKENFPSVSLILLEKNYGFCGGYNRGLKQIDADYYVLLNSDVEVTEGWLDPLTSLLDNNPKVAAAQPKILSQTTKDQFEYAGAGGGFIDAFGYPFCRGRIFNKIEKDLGQYNDQRPIFWASGACMIIRSNIYHQFAGLDEDFFAHMEEIDLCWKIHRAGKEVWYSGNSTVFHVGAGTLGYKSPFKTYLNFRNGLALIFKHLDQIEILYKLPFRIILDWLASTVLLLQGEPKNALAVLKAHVHFVRDISINIKKRKNLRRIYPAYSRDQIYRRLLILDYYLNPSHIQFPSNNPK